MSWNIRVLGNPLAKCILKDILGQNKIDVVGIQETKLESFPYRFFSTLSSHINSWYFKPSIGSAGGILVGINDNLFDVLSVWVKEFSVSVLLKNKRDSFEWIFSVVYGPTVSHLRGAFFDEIRSICSLGSGAVLICGDFNLIRRRSEKIGKSFNYV
jgi:mannosylglycoprotein endo-beta-mannosidase